MTRTSAGELQPRPIPLNIYVHDCSPVSALVIGAPGSEWILLPKQAAAFWEGHKKSSTLFQRICWGEPEKQKTRSCRAQELSRSCARWRGQKRKLCTATGPTRSLAENRGPQRSTERRSGAR